MPTRHRVITDPIHTEANTAWAAAEGLDADTIVAADLYVDETPTGLVLKGTELLLTEQGEKYLAGDGYAKRAFERPISNMPPATVSVAV